MKDSLKDIFAGRSNYFAFFDELTIILRLLRLHQASQAHQVAQSRRACIFIEQTDFPSGILWDNSIGIIFGVVVRVKSRFLRVTC